MRALESTLAPIGFQVAGDLVFLRKSESVVHVVKILWKRDVSDYAWVMVGAWHPVVQADWSANKRTTVRKIAGTMFGDRLGAAHVGSNTFFRCEDEQSTSESCMHVVAYMRAGGFPFLAAIKNARDVLCVGTLAERPYISIDAASIRASESLALSIDVASVLPKGTQDCGAFPGVGQYELMSAKTWIEKYENSSFALALLNAGFQALVWPDAEFRSVLYFVRERAIFTDVVVVTLSQFGARGTIQCLTWIPEFNGLGGGTRAVDLGTEFCPELATAWWVGPDGQTDSEIVMDFMAFQNAAKELGRLGKAFGRVDKWLKKKRDVNDLFDFPPGAAHAAHSLGVTSYNDMLHRWRDEVLSLWRERSRSGSGLAK